MNSTIVGKISFLSTFLLVTLLPIFFLPFTGIPIESSKGLFLVIGLAISVIFWIVARFLDGEVRIPKSTALLAGLGVMLATLLSAIFGYSKGVSFFGTMLDVGSFWFVFCAFLLMMIASIVFRDIKNARLVLFGTILSSGLVLVFQVFHIFFPNISSFGILTTATSNIIGSWNSLGIFAGLFVITSLFLIEFFPTTKQIKIALGILNIFALFIIIAVNFVLIWEILGIFALLVFIYKISVNSIKKTEEKKEGYFPIFSLGVVLVSLFFFMSIGLIGSTLPSKLGVTNNEVSPSFKSTMSITKAVLMKDPIFGTGPNTFADAWAQYKPIGVNGTQFWDVVFNSGSGLLPTYTATTGGLGILAWVAFILLFIINGGKWLFSSIKNNTSIEAVSFFFLALYLLIASFFYFTGPVIFLLAMIFGGVFIGLVSSGRKNGEIVISFLNDQRKTFFFMLSLIIILIFISAVGFKYVQRFASIPYFTKTLSATSVEDAKVNINRALVLNSNDLYLRAYSQIQLLELNAIVSKSEEGSLSEEDKAKLQTSLDQAINSAQFAINFNPQNYLNYQSLGTVFQTAGFIGVKDGYLKALETYQKASELNPKNPRLKLVLMNISIALNKREEAKEYANSALALKPDYLEALVALSQISRSEGSIQEAISFAQRALAISPGNKELIGYVESLKNGTAPSTIPQADTKPKEEN